MTIEERAEKAANLKATGACNCCQAVVSVFADKLPLAEEQLLAVSAGFAAGMGSMEATCGALIGASMVGGLLTNGMGSVKVSRELLQKFGARCGATICKELKGRDTGKVLCECPMCVKNAVLTLGEVLSLQ